MLHRSLAFRVVAPTIFVSLLLLGLCIAAAVYLYQQQARSAEALGENVASRRVAGQLVREIEQWPLALKSGDQTKAELTKVRVRQLLEQAWEYADKEEERRIVSDLRNRFDSFTNRPTAEAVQQM